MAISLLIAVLIGVIILKLVYEQFKIEVAASKTMHYWCAYDKGWD